MKTKLFGLFFFICCFATAQVNLDSNLTACYALNGNCFEPISGLTGTMGAVSSAADRNNAMNRALSFNGSTLSIVTLPGDTALKSKSISVSLWVKPLPGFNFNPIVLFTKNSASAVRPAYSLACVNTPGGTRFRVKKCNGNMMDSLDMTYSAYVNNWYHVCFTMDNSSIKLYINGVLNNSKTSTLLFDYAAGKNVYLGSTKEPGPNQAFTGILDNVRFYNRILNSSEVNQLFLNDPVCVSASLSPVAAFYVSPFGLCAGQPVVLVDQSLNNPESWSWQIPGAILSNPNDVLPSCTFTAAGIYTINLQVSNSIGTSSASKLLSINSTPSISIVTTSTLICRDTYVYLKVSGVNTCTWSTGHTSTLIMVAPKFSTTYSVSGVDTLGCLFNSKFLQKVAGDCWSVPEYKAFDQVAVAPNPNEGVFDLMFGKQIKCEYRLSDFIGQEILSQEVEYADKIPINISDYPNGIYFLTLRKDQQSKTIKIIKE